MPDEQPSTPSSPTPSDEDWLEEWEDAPEGIIIFGAKKPTPVGTETTETTPNDITRLEAEQEDDAERALAEAARRVAEGRGRRPGA